MSMICLSLTGGSPEECLEQASAHAQYIDAVELRADFLTRLDAAVLSRLPARLREAAGQKGLRVILTVRRRRDGGHFEGDEEARRTILEQAIRHGAFDYVDLEDDLFEEGFAAPLQQLAGKRSVTVIRSLHDFEGVPDRLPHRIESMAREAGVIPKAAVTPRGIEELRTVLSAYPVTRDRGGVLLGMGTFGFPTRVLAPVLGSFLTFCSGGDTQAAPGHVTPATLADVYRFREQGPDTAIFGVIGTPVMHSRSPHFHNDRFRRAGLDAVYVPFEVDDVNAFFTLAEELGIRGFSVTIPHKQAVIEHLSEVDDAVRATGACNTVLRTDGAYVGRGSNLTPGSRVSEGSYRGVNTDVPGFLGPLLEAFDGGSAAENGRAALAGVRATVIGAGGAARGVVYALLREGASVCILNRTLERAERLADDAAGWFDLADGREDRVVAGRLDGECVRFVRAYADLIVQTTSVGMSPNEHADPLPDYEFGGREIVYDIVYTPEQTALLRRAAAAGCRTVPGTGMFRGQAEEQARLFRELMLSRDES